MASSDALPLTSAFPADDKVEDALWLANLITAVRNHAERHGHPEIAAALDPALQAAQAIASSKTPN